MKLILVFISLVFLDLNALEIQRDALGEVQDISVSYRVKGGETVTYRLEKDNVSAKRIGADDTISKDMAGDQLVKLGGIRNGIVEFINAAKIGKRGDMKSQGQFTLMIFYRNVGSMVLVFEDFAGTENSVQLHSILKDVGSLIP